MRKFRISRPALWYRMRRLLLPLLAAAFLFAGAILLFTRAPLPDGAEAMLLLTETLQGNAYTYDITAHITADGEEREYFTLSGAVEGDAAAVSGTVLGSPLDLVYEDGILCRQTDGAWQSYPVAELAEAAELFAELTPAGAFACCSLSEPEWLEGEKGSRSFRAVPETTGWVAAYFQDPMLTVTTDRRCRKILHLTLTAAGRGQLESSLLLEADFSPLGKGDEISIPAL